jgi:hypothetical protein
VSAPRWDTVAFIALAIAFIAIGATESDKQPRFTDAEVFDAYPATQPIVTIVNPFLPVSK